VKAGFKGLAGGWLVKTGERSYCFVGQWRSFQNIVDARSQMIGFLDGMRDMLEDLGGGLGVTDPVSGEAVVTMAAPKAAKAKRPARARPRKKMRAAARRKHP
jgi:hypothetical protein